MSDSAERIRYRMRQVRSQLDHDVDDLVDSAKATVEWREYVRSNPWVCVGVALIGGYLAVPRRREVERHDPDALLELAKRGKLVVQPASEATGHNGLASMMLRIATTTAMRGAIRYLGRRFERTECNPGPGDSVANQGTNSR